MAVTRKQSNSALRDDSDKQLEQLIEAGGGTAKEAIPSHEAKPVKFTLTLPADVCEEVEEMRQQGRIGVSRHRWVLEAVLMRIEKEKAAN